MEIPEIAKLALEGGASIVLVVFGYKVFNYLKTLINNHLNHIEENTKRSVKQHEEIKEQNNKMHSTMENIHEELKKQNR